MGYNEKTLGQFTGKEGRLYGIGYGSMAIGGGQKPLKRNDRF